MPHSSYGNRDENLSLSKEEAALAKEVARQKGLTEEEAATLILKGGIERRVRRRTGKGPAKVYSMRKRAT